jgi:cytochrome oxidase Cu insertion factor (SCO1/SenC/PrrC family)
MATANDERTVARAYQTGVDLDAVPAPALALRDQSGARFTLDQLRGRPVVLTFFDSVCPHTDCSLMAQYLNWTRQDLGNDGRHVSWVAITVNPWHDTRASVKAFLASHHITLPLHYLLGSPIDLAPIWRAFHMQAVLQPDGVVVHTTGIFVLDAQSRERLYLDEGYDPKILSAYLQVLINDPAAAGATATKPDLTSGVTTQSHTIAGTTITLTASPDKYGTYAFSVAVQDGAGKPISGAQVALDLTMPSMEMKPVHVVLTPTGPSLPGTYQARGVLSMLGNWNAGVTLSVLNNRAAVRTTFQFDAQY